MMNKSASVIVNGLSVKRSKMLVLEELSFALSPGRVIGLLGPSGSGKSTLLRSIVGSQIITHGTVTVLGSSAGDKALRHRVGYMTQAASVYDDLTVRQNIAYFARILGLSATEVDRVIALTDLDLQSRKLAIDLSGGQRNRVSLAIALLGTPDIVILDEPTVGLDPVLRSDLWRLFTELAATGMSLLVSSHVMDEAMRCDELLLLREGQLLAQLTPADLLARTRTENPEEAFLALVGGVGGATPNVARPSPKHRAAGKENQP
ncbi:ABC transporter ATP-binding protein [Glutamicibacter sp. AOP12-B1-11]|uniref:ABC transporter ATP-binding protein n=1 Tax=Glutamicibacter sp. AOP12-B1-11 TaxID=3457725 RepID=UPI0040338E85